MKNLSVVFISLLLMFLVGCMQPYGNVDETEMETVAEIVIELDKNSITIEEGKEDMLIASINPSEEGQKIFWSSSDENIITVKDGIVNGISTGAAEVTAMVDGVYSDPCVVTVVKTQEETPVSPPKNKDVIVISEDGYMIDFAGNATGKPLKEITLSDKTSFKRFWLVKEGKDYIVDKNNNIIEAGSKIITASWIDSDGWCIFVEDTSPASGDGWFITRW